MREYIHKVQYYETDRMGITHHSNYIRWMEEARIDFLDQIGFGYARMEADGLISPVLSVSCKYRVSTTFSDEIGILVQVQEFKGVKLQLGYTMRRISDGAVVLTGTTEHAFLNRENKPVRLKKEFPELFHTLSELSKQAKELQEEGKPQVG